MNAKEIKSVLKQAREAIKEKEFKTALKHCKTVLNADKNNYNAWVFIGAAAQEMEQHSQAEEAFHRAITISPDELLAWQGLTNFYEKQGDKEKLCECLIKQIKLFDKDKEKQNEILKRLSDISESLKNTEKAVEVLQLKLELSENGDEDKYKMWKEILVQLCSMDKFSPKMNDLKTSALRNVTSNPSFGMESLKKIIIPYVERLCEDGSTHEILPVVELLPNRNCKKVCMESLLRLTLETFMKGKKNIDFLEWLVRESEELDLDIHLHKCALGVLDFNKKKYSSALQLLEEALKHKPEYLEALYFLCEIQLLLHLNSEAEKTAAKGLRFAAKMGSAPSVIGNLYLFLGEAFAGTRNWEAAFKAFEKCIEHLGRTLLVLKSFFMALLGVGYIEKAQKVYAELCSDTEDRAVILQMEGYMHILRHEYPIALKKLRESVSLKESAFTLHLIGRVLWEMKEYDKASKIFAKSAEMDPYFAKNFLYLGHHYMEIANHKKAARKFYRKAFDLDSTDEEAGMCLSKVLKAFGEHEENILLLQKVTENAPMGSCKWGWTQLGLLQLEQEAAPDAVVSFQNAIRADPYSCYIWECLGDAYIKRGSYESALKAYEKASELSPTSVYPLYQVSMIQKTRGLYEDAIDRFRSLQKVEESYVPGLIGLAESLLLLSKRLFSECLYGRARDCLQEILDVLSRVAPGSPQFTCLWKLAGDACTFYYHFGPEWKLLEVPPELNADGHAPKTKEELLLIGARFYGRALSLNKNLSTLWHDLGINVYYQSVLNSPSKKSLAQKSFLCLQKAVSISPANYEHWIALGTVAVISEVQDYAIGQHAFIKAIEIENNNVEAWTNLGILYLKNGDVYLAHAAFKVAQSLDPSYPLCWIGQAIIACKEKHSETLDLFRHATTLGSHDEAFLGYSQALCEALFNMSLRGTVFYKYNIEQMDAVTVASDCLVKHTANVRGSAEAFNTLGILLERQKLYRTALLSYQRALNLCTNPDNDYVEKYRTNYARLLSLTGNYEAAITEYMKLKGVNTPLLCSFAFTLYKKKEYKTAYNVLNRALTTTQDAAIKSQALVAMAVVKWSQNKVAKDDNSDMKAVQDLLLQSCQMQPPSVFGLLALWALAIKTKQINVTGAVQKILLPFKNKKEFHSPIALLSATQAFVNKGYRAAVVELQRAIHAHPSSCDIWLEAANCLLQWESPHLGIVECFTKTALFHGCDKEQASQISVLTRLASGYKKTSLVAAQKAVHIHPEKLANWITLVATCHVSDVEEKMIGWIFGFVKGLAKQGVENDVLGWLVCMEIYHNLCQGVVAPGAKLLQKALTISSFNAQTKSLLQILNAFLESSGGRLDPLVLAIKSNPGIFLSWQILVQLLIKQGKFVEAEKTLEKFVNASTMSFPKFKIYPLLQLAALSYRAMHVLEDKAKWMKSGEDALTEAIKISPNSQCVRFMQALFAIEKGNASLARRSLEKVIFSPVIDEMKWMESFSAKLLALIYTAKNDEEGLKKLGQKFPKYVELKRSLSEEEEVP